MEESIICPQFQRWLQLLLVMQLNLSIETLYLKKKSGRLQRINELHTSYLGLQYPLFSPYGEDRYRSDIKHRYMGDSHQRKRNRLTIREFLYFRLQSNKDEAQTLLRSRRLFQQFIVDGHTMMEAEQLLLIRTHQKQLRCVQYNTLKNSQQLVEN